MTEVAACQQVARTATRTCHAVDLPRVAANAPNPASTYIDRRTLRDKARRIRRAKPSTFPCSPPTALAVLTSYRR